MKLSLILMLLSILGMSSCTEINQKPENETWWINSSKKECTVEGPMSCLQIQKGEKINPNSWDFFYSGIQGFEYEPGNIYQIEVSVTDRAEPIPADASSKIYKLEKLISKEIDKSLRLTNIWVVKSINDILDPKDFKNNGTLTFEFNASEKTYFGNTGCNSIRGPIQENDGEKLLLGSGATTKMACPDMSMEQAISKALIDTRSYSIENNILTFKNEADSALITFKVGD
jgi:heat shock protein HslJ